MIKLYFSNYLAPLSEANFLKYLNLLPSEIKTNILRFKKWEDRHAGLYGKLLLKKALDDLCIDSNLSNLKYSELGRPYLENCPDFNISHSGSCVVCAISTEGKIGIDVEEIKLKSIAAFDKYFTEKEWKTISTSDNIYYWFYYYWTAKEAVIKADGKGLSLPLNNIAIHDNKIKLGEATWYISTITLFENYMIQIASDNPVKQKPELVEIFF